MVLTIADGLTSKMASLAMTAEPLTLERLPADVMYVLISHLDPVTLIAMSQTSRGFRQLINPQRYHFVERLLAIELDPRIGGITPLFRGRDNKVIPPFHDEAWNSNLYACCTCMKLRLHGLFDNQAILRLRLRKPPPGSDEWNRMQRTEWEPIRGGVNYQRKTAHFRQDREKREAATLQYHRASTGYYYAQNQVGFARADMDPIDKMATEAESYLVGTQRHKRICLDCRFARGDFNRPTRNALGTAEAPIVRSRQLRAPPDSATRLFPGLLPLMDQWPILFKVHNRNRRSDVVQVYASRCRGCHTWQNYHGAFRRSWEAWGRPSWGDCTSKHKEIPLCNQCALAKRGEKRFTCQFRGWAISEFTRSLRYEFHILIFGWRIIRQDFDLDKPPGISRGVLHDYQDTGKQILRGLTWTGGGEVDVGGDLEDIIKFDVTDFRERYEWFRTFLETEAPPGTARKMSTGWFKYWYEEYPVYEASFIRARDALQRAKDDPEWPRDWALEPKRYHLSNFCVPPECAASNAPNLPGPLSQAHPSSSDE